MASRTRNKSGTKLTEFFGGPAELLRTEAPTLRDVMRKGLLIQEEMLLMEEVDRRNFPVRELSDKLADEVNTIWLSSNPQFIPPVVSSSKSVANRISTAWKKFQSICRGRENKKTEDSWTAKLDKLFDITICRCSIFLCEESESQCSGSNCSAGAHINCTCPRPIKLPVLDLVWLKSQREKIGSKSKFQLGKVDVVETERLNKLEKRKNEAQETMERQKKKKEEYSTQLLSPVSWDDVGQLGEGSGLEGTLDSGLEGTMESEPSQEDVDFVPEKDAVASLTKKNMLDISNTASAAMRYQVSSTATAAISSGFLADLIKGGVLDKDKSHLAVDKKKVQRAMTSVMEGAAADAEVNLTENPVTGLFADGRKDKTLVMSVDPETGKYHRRVVTEEHISVTQEPAGVYLTHYTPPPADIGAKPAKQQAQALYDWLVEHGIDKTLPVIGGDTTASMSGHKGGFLAHLEEMLGRKCFVVMCCLHINELPLRHLVTKLDGPTSSDKGWTGPIGKALANVNKLTRVDTFVSIPQLEPLVDLPEEVLKDMSTDSSICYRLVKASESGVLEPDLRNRLVGSLSHARWMTTGQALILLYMSEENGLNEAQMNTLTLIVKWVAQVYFHMFYRIKVYHRVVNGPHHLLTLLRLFRQQDPLVQEAVSPYIKSEAWWAHPEQILVSLLCSSDPTERNFAVSQIRKSREGYKARRGKKKIRERKVPATFNIEATSLMEMIDWDSEKVTEPVFTSSLSLEELDKIRDSPMNEPDYPLHSQSCERAVKQVTEASGSVCGWERRDGFVRARMESRELMPVFKSKQDLVNLFESL